MKTRKLLQLLSLATVALLVACGEKKVETKKEEKVKVVTEIVQTQLVQQEESFTASVEAEAVNQISPAIPARIRKIYVDVGAQVAKGQRLVEMDNTSLDQQRVQLNTLEKDQQRYEELFKAGGISQQQVDQIKTQVDMLRKAISNLQENTSLVSPISGTVTDRNYDEGDVFAQRPILTVQQLNPVKALVNISEMFFPKITVGMPVKIKLDIYGEEVFQGKVKLIYPTIDANTHTFACEVAIPNVNTKIRPGMFARVILNFGEMSRVVIPDGAVMKQTGSNDRYVFTVVNGKAVYNSVQIGQRLDDKWEIISGIQPGDVIVTSGQTKIVDGTAVEVVK